MNLKKINLRVRVGTEDSDFKPVEILLEETIKKEPVTFELIEGIYKIKKVSLKWRGIIHKEHSPIIFNN